MKRNVTIWFFITSYMHYFWNVFSTWTETLWIFHAISFIKFWITFEYLFFMIIPVYLNSKIIMFVQFRFTNQTFEWLFSIMNRNNEMTFLLSNFESPNWHLNIAFSNLCAFSNYYYYAWYIQMVYQKIILWCNQNILFFSSNSNIDDWEQNNDKVFLNM